MEVPFFRFSHSDAELRYLKSVLESGWLTTGRYAAEFERQFAERIECEYALAVNSCTAALHLVLEAIGVGPGDQVIVPSLTFTASAEIVRYLGADPIFVDVDPCTGLVTSGHIKEALDRHTNVKACIVVHFAGQPVELIGDHGVLDLCQRRSVALVQDAAHAFPAADAYGPVGKIGDATCFSFYANKTITTGEGGMITTNNGEIARRAKIMRLHGIDRDVWDRFTTRGASWDYDVVAPGYKYNMPDINAAIGLGQLQKAEEFRERRQQVALRYDRNFAGIREVSTLTRRVAPEQHAWHLYPIVLRHTSKVSRNELMDALKQDGVATSVHYKPLHRMTYYAQTYDLVPDSFPNAEAYWLNCLSLPLFPSMTLEQADYVTERVLAHCCH